MAERGNVKLKLKLQLQARGDNFARVHQPHQPGELNHTGWFPSHAAALISTSLFLRPQEIPAEEL